MRRTFVLLLGAVACKVKDPPPITTTWHDDFERSVTGESYYNSGGNYSVQHGALSTKGSRNRPLWLRRKLPRDVRVEVTAWSNTSEGDIKLELFGDGYSSDDDGGAYQATGYVFIFGGWGNSKSMIARGDEHGQDLVTRTAPKVVPGKRYRFALERRGSTLRWFIDDMVVPFLTFDDGAPLAGIGHEYFAFSNWESDVWFDDLVVTPL